MRRGTLEIVEGGWAPSQLGGVESIISWNIGLDVLVAAKDVRTGCSGRGWERRCDGGRWGVVELVCVGIAAAFLGFGRSGRRRGRGRRLRLLFSRDGNQDPLPTSSGYLQRDCTDLI